MKKIEVESVTKEIYYCDICNKKTTSGDLCGIGEKEYCGHCEKNIKKNIANIMKNFII